MSKKVNEPSPLTVFMVILSIFLIIFAGLIYVWAVAKNDSNEINTLDVSQIER